MGMPTPPRPSRKEFTGRDTYNSNSLERDSSFHEDRNDASSFYRGNAVARHEDDFIGNARDYVTRMRADSPMMPRSEPRRPNMTRSLSEYNDTPPRYNNNDRFHRDSSSPYGDDDSNVNNVSKYEIMGMKEQLKKHESTRLHLEEALENAISEKVSIESRLREEMSNLHRSKAEEMERLHKKYSEEQAEQRGKLVETFKEDMMEMKSEWENAFGRLKEEAEATKRALMAELENASDAKVDLETKLGEVTAEYKTRLEEERERMRERMEECKRGKEEDLDRLRGMYEGHLESLREKMEEEREGLKDEIGILLEENEKIKGEELVLLYFTVCMYMYPVLNYYYKPCIIRSLLRESRRGNGSSQEGTTRHEHPLPSRRKRQCQLREGGIQPQRRSGRFARRERQAQASSA
jgi:hypothetical protein